jgi:hypothetical protein
MKSPAHFATRHAAALVVGVALLACSHDSTEPALGAPPAVAASAPGAGGSGASPHDTVGTNPGEWHLQTIRGAVIGLERATTGDTSAANTTPVANATVEIHKISLVIGAPAGADSASRSLQDLGIVATKTTDAAGRFEYVLADPIVVKTGEPTPLVTYRLTVIPPAGSPFVGQSGMQVLFAEQLGGDGVSHYYLFRPKN